MKTKLMAVTVAAILGFPGVGYATLSKEERKTEQDRISSAYKAAKENCKGMKGNAKDICMAEAKGAQKVAKAELDARDKGTAKEQANVRIAKAEAEYGVAKEKCDDLKGNDKDVCNKDAKAALTRAKSEAKVSKEAAAASKDAKERVAEARKDARQDTQQADYKAARERCDSLSGDAKDRCQKEVKDRFGK
ncbi:MAG TPA: hypothetical protein VFC14_12640 [Burkholderiales bacterium]|jgi:hypothetical protein|nr:hypothetical protein [Burkholderiales bacterium]